MMLGKRSKKTAAQKYVRYHTAALIEENIYLKVGTLRYPFQ